MNCIWWRCYKNDGVDCEEVCTAFQALTRLFSLLERKYEYYTHLRPSCFFSTNSSAESDPVGFAVVKTLDYTYNELLGLRTRIMKLNNYYFYRTYAGILKRLFSFRIYCNILRHVHMSFRGGVQKFCVISYRQVVSRTLYYNA